jgi:hypothetical protein
MQTTTATADVTAAPDRERLFPPSNWDRKPQRFIEREWTCYTTEDGKTVTVSLYCGHTRGQYFAHVNNHVHEDNIMTCAPFSAKQLPAEPCARYSKAALIDFAERTLAGFRNLAATGELNEYLRGDKSTL